MAGKRMNCIGKGCRNEARLAVVDFLEPILEREQLPACARHALLWYRQGRGSIRIFPLGDGEATSLTEDQIIAEVFNSGEPPLKRK